jgi:hypothetical protein
LAQALVKQGLIDCQLCLTTHSLCLAIKTSEGYAT